MTRPRVLVGLVLVGAGLLCAPPSLSAQTQVTEFESVARSNCSPLPSCALPLRGTISCPGGTEISSGLFPPWCSPESRTRVRERMLKYVIVLSTDPRVAGEVTMLFNMNLDTSTFKGPLWGTYTIELPGRGVWEGTLVGTAHSGSFWTYKVVLFGAGEFEGQQVRAQGVWRAGQGDRLNGEIMVPGN